MIGGSVGCDVWGQGGRVVGIQGGGVIVLWGHGGLGVVGQGGRVVVRGLNTSFMKSLILYNLLILRDKFFLT